MHIAINLYFEYITHVYKDTSNGIHTLMFKWIYKSGNSNRILKRKSIIYVQPQISIYFLEKKFRLDIVSNFSILCTYKADLTGPSISDQTLVFQVKKFFSIKAWILCDKKFQNLKIFYSLGFIFMFLNPILS